MDNGKALLIEPQGIEIYSNETNTNKQRLLIEPQGIEIREILCLRKKRH